MEKKKMTQEELQTRGVYETARVEDKDRLVQLIEYSSPDMGCSDENHCSALCCGVQSGDVETVRYLVERIGLDPLRADQEGVTAWDIAYDQDKREVLACFTERCGYFREDMYHNLVRRGLFPDPSVVRVGEDYYMVNSSFMFFSYIPVSHSGNLIRWEIIGYAVTNPAYARLEELKGSMGYWATDISWCEERFYIIATLRCNNNMPKKRIQVVISPNHPQGPYDKPVFLDDDGIDPSIFHNEDGRKYMLLNRGARILELSRDCGRIVKTGRLLWYGDYKCKLERPHLIKKDGYYYLFLAEGGTGMSHCITVARSGNMYGPYRPDPRNPILHQWDEGALIQCCGHGKPFQLPDGRWCIVYLCLREMGGEYGILGRETVMDTLNWTQNGWPVISGGRGPSDQQRRPLNRRTDSVGGDGIFRKLSLSCPLGGYPFWRSQSWMTPRPLSYDKVSQGGYSLLLIGTKTDLNSPLCRSILVRRQDAFRFCAVYSFQIPLIKDGESPGLTCCYDEDSYIKYGPSCRNGRLGILYQEYVRSEYRSVRFEPVFPGDTEQNGEVTVKVEGENLKRSFFYQDNGIWIRTVEMEDTGYLSSEGLKNGRRFTDAILGIYIHGSFQGRFTGWSYMAE